MLCVPSLLLLKECIDTLLNEKWDLRKDPTDLLPEAACYFIRLTPFRYQKTNFPNA